MPEEKAECLEALRRILEQKAASRGPEFIEVLWPTLQANCLEGRIQKFLRSGTVESRDSYVVRLISYYDQEQEYVYKVQRLRDHNTWLELYAKLQKWAYWLLVKAQFSQGAERVAHAQDCAADAGGQIVNSRFPYDTNFAPWAHRVVDYTCRQYVARAWHPSNQFNEKAISLDAWDEWLHNIADPTAEEDVSVEGVHRFETRQALLQAIGQLSPTQQEVVLLHYFEQKSFAEIARLLDCPRNTVYQRHYRALKNLGKILGGDGDIDE